MIANIALRIQMALLMIGVAAGCSTSSSVVNFYALAAMEGGAPTVATEAKSAPAIGIGRVTLPAYLQRPHIVIRTDANQMRIEEYHRWAGSLEDDIQRVLIENLMQLTGTERIARMPWPGDFQPDVTVRMEIYRFEAGTGNTVRLLAAVTLIRRVAPQAPETWTVNLETSSEGRGYADLVAAQSRLLADVSRNIAEKIASH